MPEEQSFIDRLLKEHMRVIWGLLFVLGLYLILYVKDYVAGIPVTLIAGYMLTKPDVDKTFSESSVVAFNEFKDEPDGILVNHKSFNEVFAIDNNASNFSIGRLFRRGTIMATKNFFGYEVTTMNTWPIFLILRRVKGNNQVRFVEYYESMRGAVMPHSDMRYWLEEQEKGLKDTSFEDAFKRVSSVMGFKRKRRSVRALASNTQNSATEYEQR